MQVGYKAIVPEAENEFGPVGLQVNKAGYMCTRCVRCRRAFAARARRGACVWSFAYENLCIWEMVVTPTGQLT